MFLSVFLYFNSSLDGLGGADRAVSGGIGLQFQFQFGWFGRQFLRSDVDDVFKFQFQFGWFGSFARYNDLIYLSYFNSSLDGLGV